ncbi:toll/interleukin-1 receptor domain-containing protein, partial [Frankia sp. ACN1ag]|uniref:toll/interleukin-1 receptor domain-containing protein n=1 Tax=Frankia sp. ACN1ag TaxID=102891 RepID=UPI001F237F83
MWDPGGVVTGADTHAAGRVADGHVHFFVSYTGVDQRWAEWISWQLEEAGYQVLVQPWDFGAGAHLVYEMNKA